MSPVDSVLLLHRGHGPDHYDWFFEHPADRAGALVSWRVLTPIQDWASGFELERRPDHRRAYLHFEGPVSGDRGVVQAVSRGRIKVVHWSAGAAILDLTMSGFAGRLQLQQSEGDRWTARHESLPERGLPRA